MSKLHDGAATLAVASVDEAPEAEPLTLAERLLAEYRLTGSICSISGGDHEGDGDGNDDSGTNADESREDASNTDGSNDDGDGADDGTDEGDGDGDVDDEGDSEDIGKLRDDLKKARNEAKNLRRRLRQAERERDQARSGQSDAAAELQTELETTRNRVGELEDELRDIRSRDAVRTAAEQAGAISPNAVFAMIRDDLTYDDRGTPTNVSDAIEQLRTKEPSLFNASAGRVDGGATGEVIDAKNPVDRMSAAYAANQRRK